MGKRYDTPKAGEWIQPVRKGYKLACCDCGLVHTVDFRVLHHRVQFRVFRNSRATGQIRRWMRSIAATEGRGNLDATDPR